MQSASDQWFDEAYYQRFYYDKKTSVVDPEHIERLSTFVCSYLKYLRIPVTRVLDLGCGIGLWKDALLRQFPGCSYHGVELSEYLCGKLGWERGSVVNFQSSQSYDLVICQGVLPYLSPADLKLALKNLGHLSHGALYVEAVTREDYEQDIIDEDLTDPRIFRHRAALYRQGLSQNFRELGGGLWMSRKSTVPVFELECTHQGR